MPRDRKLEWLRDFTSEECLAQLRDLSGVDLGSNPEAWEKWRQEEKERLDIDLDF